jgi:formate hydrogenlyase subunit 3/multisubunit Na+/H+ antiporter MnhD subunit
VIFLAIFANFAAAFLTHGRRRQLFTVAGLLIGTTLALFFVWTYPANEATGNWTSVPENWEQLRIQWEYSHAVNAALTFLALLCAVGAALSIDSRHEMYGRHLPEEATEAQDQLTAQNTPRLEHVASKSMAADKIVYTSPSPQAQSRRMR